MHTHAEEKMSKSTSVSGGAYGIGVYHPLAYAGQLWHRAVINKEPVGRVASDFGLEAESCRGLVRMLKQFGGVPSRERLAVICQLDPGFDDEDVGEVFGMDAAWSASVRMAADSIREAEQIPAQLEWFDGGLRPSDPPPEEIYARAKAVRVVPGRNRAEAQPGIRSFAWRSRVSSFFPIGVE
jgi:hypothetical protein